MLFDFERAYDKVWRDALLWKLMKAGVSRTMVRWVQAWLANRMAWVKVDGVRSKSRKFQQGLPQGSVLSPLLFLVYINDLVEELAEGIQVSAFADDIAVWHTGRTARACRKRAQWATNVVERWSEEWLMRLSTAKCSVTLFSNDRRDVEMEGMEVRMAGQELKKEKKPCFLGVTYDVGMTFGKQVERAVGKAKQGVRLLRRLAGRDWGWRKELLRVTSMALVGSTLLYGSAAWGPWVAKSVWEKLERVQLEAARIVGGTLRSAPREAVLTEAGLSEVRRMAEGLWMAEYEKCLRATEEEPRREWGLRSERRRLKRKDWRSVARELLESVMPEEVARMRKEMGEAPWKTWQGVEWDIEERREKDEEENRRKALARLEEVKGAELTLYTDGSAMDGRRNGGAGIVVTKGEPSKPEKVEEVNIVAGRVASSFQAELYALVTALEWLREKAGEWRKAMVVSDSQAALRALAAGGGGWLPEILARGRRIGRELGNMGKEMVFVWVPGHCGLIGNEWADAAAGQANSGDQSECECLYESVKRVWKRREGRREWVHDRCRKVYGEGMRSEEEKEWTREEAVSMARFRSGHSMELNSYRKRIGLEERGECRRCGEEEETLEHVVECVAGGRKRLELNVEFLSDLCCRPRGALAYWRWWRRVRLKPRE